jgi:alkylation response protein AidB-like acyl-CoA dehydrogenase/predicted heme/steroid binding protein
MSQTGTVQVQTYTREEVAKHNTEEDLWLIIDNTVYDVTKFGKFHPGGHTMLIRSAGKDVTNEFKSYHNELVLQKYKNLAIGQIISTQSTKPKSSFQYSEPAWYTSGDSPYYNESHVKFRKKMREFVDREIIPFVHEWDTKGTYPAELREKAFKEGIYGAIWPKEYGGTPPEGCEKADAFHLLIFVDELSRSGCGGLLWSCFFSFSISLPPVLKVGSEYIKNKVAKDIITGKKIMSLAVTEPSSGSDVAALEATAKLITNEKGEEVWLVNGEKRYISGGVSADYYTVAVKTPKGITLLLVERTMPGVTPRRQPTQGWLASNTGFIQFKDVQVPKENIIGEEGKGWLAVMHNFNQERFVFCAMMNRYSRVCLTDAVQFARHRKTFGKTLSQHDVIRSKIAQMCARVESNHAFLESIAYSMTKGKVNEIGGTIALAKARCTDGMRHACTEATQIMGGVAYIRGGVGERVERLSREVNVNSVAGGSYEIMEILAMKQARL